LNFVGWIQEGKNDPQKEKKLRFMIGSAGCSLLRAEGFSCSLDVLHGGLGISKLKFMIKKILHFSDVNFFYFLVIKTLDPEQDLELDPEPDQH
jgi:hypothetical protein